MVPLYVSGPLTVAVILLGGESTIEVHFYVYNYRLLLCMKRTTARDVP